MFVVQHVGYPAMLLWTQISRRLRKGFLSAWILMGKSKGFYCTLDVISCLLQDGGRRLHDFELPEPENGTAEVVIECMQAG
jgi:hypothetical protein